ncbi:hypothetical protein RCD82_22800 [Klebsiella pneumoniae]|uniref:hypothetical protein n=1 Tax=Klebsiella pneumoniae TaxID=573 RepID=UPI0007609180|nr:hypothetical protein [Klebsiella pneumoniae]HDT2742583.1 hypothetical protein [Klebsiella pneumoniae subsp. pneumoniae]EKV3433086.1 hypothetical protein [Klebsiella pneumoniae]MDQ5014173.1 hypothetical protein [Klebsiella pneumoniae]MDQ5107466.1 hypothetical protein [Klebsiella pneumoniae]PNM31919.1 hypothetical protein AL478_003170 [Klebsiella pneumoniae]
MTITLQMVNELIASLESSGELSIREQKFLKLAKAFKQLAAENVALKSAVTKQIELRSEIKKAGRPPHADFWVQSICEAEDRVSKALNGTPATDRIVAGIKADGVEEFAAKLRIPGDDQFFDALAKGVALAADDFAKQLREVADK